MKSGRVQNENNIHDQLLNYPLHKICVLEVKPLTLLLNATIYQTPIGH